MSGTKDPHAVALGRKGGLRGGRARADKMSPDERSASAKKAVEARWEKWRSTIVLPMEDIHPVWAAIRLERFRSGALEGQWAASATPVGGGAGTGQPPKFDESPRVALGRFLDSASLDPDKRSQVEQIAEPEFKKRDL